MLSSLPLVTSEFLIPSYLDSFSISSLVLNVPDTFWQLQVISSKKYQVQIERNTIVSPDLKTWDFPVPSRVIFPTQNLN